MPEKTPITLVSGPLGSGKTTLLRHLLAETSRRLAVVVNEFGELGIDAALVRSGRDVAIAELDGGCVCCSLIGEFESAVEEIVASAAPDAIVVEATGVAEPDGLVADITEELPGVRIDGVVTVVDADGLVRFPDIGTSLRIQLETADLVLLNKVDLVSGDELAAVEARVRAINPRVPLVHTRHCRVEPGLLLGIGRDRELVDVTHRHQPGVESFAFESARRFDRACFERWADALDAAVYRAKGFVRFEDGTASFNFVGGRWDLEPFETPDTRLVFIGDGVRSRQDTILRSLRSCQT